MFGAGLVQLLPAVGFSVFQGVYRMWSHVSIVDVAMVTWSLLGGTALLFASHAIRRSLSRRAILVSIVLIATMIAMACVGLAHAAPEIAEHGWQGSPLEVLVSIGIVYVAFAAYTLLGLWRLQNWAAKQRDNPPLERTGPAV